MKPERAAERALARFEARKLITHPVQLVAVALTTTVLITVGAAPEEDFLSYKYLVGAGLVPVAMCVMLVAGLAASRSYRSGSDELFATMPVQPRQRVSSLLVALTGPVAVATVGLFVVVSVIQPWHGLAAPGAPPGQAESQVASVTPGMLGLLQGPVLVAFAGTLGVALARWMPHPLAVSTAAVVGAYLLMPAVAWWQWDWERFLLPAAHDLRTGTWIDSGSGQAVLLVRGSTPAALAWHVAYLTGWAALLAGVALIRDRPRRPGVFVATGGLVVILAAGVLQVVAWEAGGLGA